MWYTPCSGIWQTVWLEPVPESYIRSLSIRTGEDWAEITAEGIQDGFILGKNFFVTSDDINGGTDTQAILEVAKAVERRFYGE